ncbi:unnamed protein product [Phytomonas sp. EM1]|nr:unnamed protein product [Phytomonas sp. EM1]|eukprot:CCW60746.1 unnamed protein product [Phytomonas sp. isolate EM1]
MTDFDYNSFKDIRLLRQKLANDPASVTKKLRDACDVLELSQHSTIHDPLGVLVALFSSRMPSTVWTVLFQKLRESKNIKIKLSIFQHFAHVSEYIPVSEKANAFRIFAQEAVVLLSKEEVIVDIGFKNSFRLIVESLGMFSEKLLCSQMLAILMKNMRIWVQSDLLRASAFLSSSLVCFTNGYEPPIPFLNTAKKTLSLYVFSLVLDSCAPLIIDRSQRLAENGASYSEFIHLKELLDDAVCKCFLENKMDSAQPIPSLISCFIRVKEFDPEFSLSEEARVCHQVLLALKNTNTRRLLLSSLLSFLQKTRINWWKHVDIVFSFSLTGDASTRSYAFLAIANAAQAIQVNEILNIQPMLLDLCYDFIQKGCVMKVCGILSVFKTSFMKLKKRKKASEDLFNRLFTLISKAPIVLKYNCSIQLLVLELIQISCAYSPNLLLYVIQCFDSDHPAVQKGALETLLNWCTTQIIEESFLESPNFREIDFFEKSWYRDIPQISINQSSLYHITHNLKSMANFFLHRLSESVGEISGKSTATENACTAIIKLDEFSKSHIMVDDTPLMYMMSSFEIITTNMLSYNGMVPLTTFIKLMQAATACLGKGTRLQPISMLYHKDLFNLMCSIVFYCSQIIEPDVSYMFESDECFYGAFVELPSVLRTAINNVFLSAHHNTEPFKNTDFYAFIEAVFLFLTRLTEIGVLSRVFIQHLRKLHSSLLKCISIFVETNPQSVFHFLKIFTKLVFTSLSEHENYEFFSRDFVHIFPAIRHCIIRGFSLDLFSIGPALFELLIFFIDLDCPSNLTRAYSLVDTDFSLVEIVISELLSRKGYAPRYGFDAVETLLQTLLKLVKSPHKHRVTLLITPEKYKCIVKNLNRESRDSDLSILIRCKEYLYLISKELLLLSEVEERPFGTLSPYVDERAFLSTYFGLFEASCKYKGLGIEIDHILPYELHQSPYFLVLKASNDPSFIDKAIGTVSSTPCEPWLKCLLIMVIVNSPSHSRLRCRTSESVLWREMEVSKQVIHFLRIHNGQDSSMTGLGQNHMPITDGAKGIESSKDNGGCADFDYLSYNFDVSSVLNYMPYGVSAVSASPTELVVEDHLSDLTVTDMFDCCSRKNCLTLFHTLCNENQLKKINVHGAVALAQCLMQSRRHKDSYAVLESVAFAEHIESLLDSVCSLDNEFAKCFRYSALFLLAWFYCDVVDPVASSDNTLLSNTLLCLKIIRHYGFHDAENIGNVIEAVLERLSSSEKLISIEESTLLLLVRIFGGTFNWIEWLKSLLQHGTLEHFKTCLKVSHFVTFLPSAWFDVKNIFSSILQLSEFDTDVSTDKQRYLLWLLSSTLCHSKNGSLDTGKNIFQIRFTDSCSDFSNFLKISSLTTPISTLSNAVHENVLPPFMRRNGLVRHSWNPHYRQRLLSLCGCLHPQAPSNVKERDAYMDLLHFYLETVSATLSHPHTSSPRCFYDMMGSLAIICANGGISFKKSSWQTDSVHLFEPFVNHLLEYLKGFEMTSLNTSKPSRTSVLNEHTGLFLRPISSTKFYDTFGLVTACKLLCCKTFHIYDDGPFATDGLLSNCIRNLMSIDHFTYLAAHSCIRILGSNSSVLKKMTWLLSYCSQQFIEDLQLATSWGYLSFSVGAMQLLGTACVIACSWPNDERLCSKICEGLWNGVLEVTLSRALTFNGYELMRVLISNTVVGGRQWDMLRILVTDGWRENSLIKAPRIPTACEVNNSFSYNKGLLNHSASVGSHLCSQRQLLSEEDVVIQLLSSRVHAEQLVTQSFLLLRSKQDITNDESSADSQSALISSLLDRCQILNETEIRCLEVLIADGIAKDYYNVFFFFNHFKISLASRRIYLCVLLSMLHRHMLNIGKSGDDAITPEIINLLLIFLECAIQCVGNMSDVVWIITALLISLISFQSPKVSCAVALAILPPQPQVMYEMLSRALIKFLARGPLSSLVIRILSSMRENMNAKPFITPYMNEYILSLLKHIDCN